MVTKVSPCKQQTRFFHTPYFNTRFISKSRTSRRRWRSQSRAGRYFSVSSLFTQNVLVCRICKGNHLVVHCPNRGQEEPVSTKTTYKPKSASKQDIYLPPGQRDRSSGRHHEPKCCVFLMNRTGRGRPVHCTYQQPSGRRGREVSVGNAGMVQQSASRVHSEEFRHQQAAWLCAGVLPREGGCSGSDPEV